MQQTLGAGVRGVEVFVECRLQLRQKSGPAVGADHRMAGKRRIVLAHVQTPDIAFFQVGPRVLVHLGLTHAQVTAMAPLRRQRQLVFERLREEPARQRIDTRDQRIVDAVIAHVEKSQVVHRLADARADFAQALIAAVGERCEIDDGQLCRLQSVGC